MSHDKKISLIGAGNIGTILAFSISRKKLGNITENGKLMFIYQAIEAFYIWHGFRPKIDDKIIELVSND